MLLLVGIGETVRKKIESHSSFLAAVHCSLDEASVLLTSQRFTCLLIGLRGEGRREIEFLRNLKQKLTVLVALPRRLGHLAPELVGLGVGRIFYPPLQPQSVARELNKLMRLPSIGISLFDDSERRNPVKALRTDFLLATKGRLQELVDWTKADWKPEAAETWRREVHKLVGNLGVFGFASQVSRAREIEVALGGQEALSIPERLTVSLIASEILVHLETEQECDVVPIVTKQLPPSVMVYSDDKYHASEIAVGLSRRGFHCLTNTLSEFEPSVASKKPNGVVLDLEGISEEKIVEMGGVLENLEGPVLVLDQPLHLKRRVVIANSGVAAIMEKPVEVLKTVGMMQDLLTVPALTKVVVVDDDPIFLATLQALFLQHDIRVTGLSSGHDLWDVLETRNPDILLLDIDMLDLDGISLCKAIRSDSRFSQLPIVFVSAMDTPEMRKEAFRAGGDDFISKTCDRLELMGRVAARIARNRVSRRLEFDRLTGLVTRAPAMSRIKNLFGQSKKRGLPTSIAVLDLDHFKSVNDRYGHPVGDKILRSIAKHLVDHFRTQDVVARWGGEEFVVALFAMNSFQAVQRLERVLEAVKLELHRSEKGETFHVSFSAGVAEFPRDGEDLQTLYKNADLALYQAKDEGRSRVKRIQKTLKVLPKVDIVLVEDDHPLGTVIVDGLRQLGFSIVWYRSRADATVAFKNGISAKVLLLDHDLPDGNGLDFLTEFAGPAMEKTSVIVLSSHLNEEEILSSFTLGADDYLSKPFFLSVLLKRIENSLMTEASR